MGFSKSFAPFGQLAQILFYRNQSGVMKKVGTIIFFVVLIYSAAFSQSSRFDHMVGKWQIISDQEHGGSLDVIDSTTILIKFGGEEKRLSDCKIDFSKSPYWFDFSAKDTTTTSSNFKSLLEFIGDDTMRWQVFVDEERPDHFTSNSGELFYLQRIIPKQPAIVTTSH